MERLRVSTRAGFVALSTLAVTLLAGEVVLRLSQYPTSIKSGWDWNHSPRRNFSPPDDNLQNQMNLRGVPFSYGPDDVIVLLVGDSQVEAATGRPEFMPERRLEAYLNGDSNRSVKVFSLASSGWGNDQQLLALERYFQTYRADVVLVWSTPGNDFWENTFPDRSVTAQAGHLKPTFWYDGTKLQGPFFHGDVYLSDSRMWELVLRARLRLLGRSPQQYLLDRWLQRLPSETRQFDERPATYCADHPIIDQQDFLRGLFTVAFGQGVVVRTNEGVEQSRSHFSPYIEPRSQRDQYLIDITRAVLSRIKQVAMQYGAVFRVIYPIRTDLDRLGKQSLRCIETNPGKQFVARWDMLELITSVVEENDLLSFLVPGGEELSVSAADRHFSDAGNDRAMRILASELVDHRLVQR